MNQSNVPQNNASATQPPLNDDQVDDVSLERAIWQKPGLVINKLGDLSNKTIVDIGVGNGYFALRLAPKVSKIIAVDIDPNVIAYIDSVKNTFSEDLVSKIETRHATPSNPNINENEADIVMIINTVAYLPDLKTYFKSLKRALKPDGILMVIDFKMKRLPINAPPKSERVYLDIIEDLLGEVNYEILESDDFSLDYQYILLAKNKK